MIKNPKIIAFGFSLSSLPLLERLKARKHVDQIFISDSSSLSVDKKIEGLLQSMPIDFLQDHMHHAGLVAPDSIFFSIWSGFWEITVSRGQ